MCSSSLCLWSRRLALSCVATWLLLQPHSAVAQYCESRSAFKADELIEMVKGHVPDDVILQAIARRPPGPPLTPLELVNLQKEGASETLLTKLNENSPIYIGWSVIAPDVLRDNFGRGIRKKYFGIDIALANRSVDKGLMVTAFEFCLNQLKEVSADPSLVRGSLVKGELTGPRTIIFQTIHATGLVAGPAQGFFKSQAIMTIMLLA